MALSTTLLQHLLAWSLIGTLFAVDGAPVKRNTYTHLETTTYGDAIFGLGNLTYLANLQNPKTTLALAGQTPTISAEDVVPFTVIVTNETVMTQDLLQEIVTSYVEGDDVYTEDFLTGIYISSTASSAVVDSSALNYLSGINVSYLFLDSTFSSSSDDTSGEFITAVLPAPDAAALPAGPYAATFKAGSVSFSSVYLLYPDTYRDFLYGAYDANDGQGTFNPLGLFLPKFWDPMIPWNDDRPLAGERVAIKDLFDIKGLQTSAGSQAWAYITPTANETAPAVQRIVTLSDVLVRIDLGGIIIGKQKLAQFASGANPWEWQDAHYPFNPRGDGWLTCSASSSGGGCSIAAYDWLDFAIGSDTGSSMRRPAAVSGTYGQRPSQGLISLERVIPLGDATDTAGVFSRDPYKWIKFSKAWYTPALHQDVSITGLSPLVVHDSDAFPRTILYPVEYLPLNNSAAQPILEEFIANLTRIFNMTVTEFNFTATVQNATVEAASNLTALNAATGVINTYSQYEKVARPLIERWAELFDGRFPPIDPARRRTWRTYNDSLYTAEYYADALALKREAVDWYEANLQYSTPESCSESLMLYDIGTGGLPSFREQVLNDSPDASYLAVLPNTGAKVTVASICPIFGCADFTVPIGQVPYFSNVTFVEEMVPVTINMVVKRGCDFVLYNMIERLADEGVLRTVKTGRTAF